MTRGYGTRLFITFLFVLAILTGYNYFFQPFSFIEFAGPSPTLVVQPSPSPIQTTQQVFSNLTPRQKISQVVAAPLTAIAETRSATSAASPSAVTTTEWKNLSWAQTSAPGFVTLYGENISIEAVRSLGQLLESSLTAEPVLPIVAVDHEGGSVQRLNGSGFTSLKSWEELCQLDATEMYQQLNTSAQELNTAGIDMVFAPVLDVNLPGSPLGDRACDNDPAVIAGAAAEYIAIFSQQGILPVIKHFPGIGQTQTDLHTNFASITVNYIDTQLYKAILEDYPSIGVMVSHIGVDNQDSNTPCSLNLDCVGELQAAYPRTLIISDALDMNAAGHQVSSASAAAELPPRSLPERAVAAVRAGNNVIVFGEGVTPDELDAVLAALLQEYEADEVFQQQIDLSVAKILERKL